MHFHAYQWIGDKAVFDKGSLRRPPSPVEPTPTSPPDVTARYREAVAEWRTADLPPLETAYWPAKPAALIRGTWARPEAAAQWLRERLAEYAPRFASPTSGDASRLARLIAYAAETLARSSDVSLGH